MNEIDKLEPRPRLTPYRKKSFQIGFYVNDNIRTMYKEIRDAGYSGRELFTACIIDFHKKISKEKKK